MSELMQPLRDEHHEPLPSIDALRATADAIGAVPLPELRRHIAEATSSTPTTCCPTQPSKNRVRHAACSGLPFEEQVLMWWNFVARYARRSSPPRRTGACSRATGDAHPLSA
jgi:hypothetical protein